MNKKNSGNNFRNNLAYFLKVDIIHTNNEIKSKYTKEIKSLKKDSSRNTREEIN